MAVKVKLPTQLRAAAGGEGEHALLADDDGHV